MSNLLLMLVFMLTVGCAGMTGKYHPVTWAAIDRVLIYEPVDTKIYGYGNKDIEVTYTPDIYAAGTKFSFKNKTKEVIKIIWNESVFIDETGSTEPVFHNGVKLIDRSGIQPPSVILPGGIYTDRLIPISGVSMPSTMWKYYPVCGKMSLYAYKVDMKPCLNKSLGYFITYEVNGKKKNFTVKFKLKETRPIKKKK